MGRSNKKKVVWLFSHLLFRTGGNRFILEVTRRLQKSWDVSIIIEKASLEIKNEFKQNGINISEIGSLTSISPIYWLFFPLMLRMNEKRIKKETNDADVIISGMFPMNFIATKLDKPTIQNCWEPYALFHDKHYINGFTRPQSLFIRTLAVLYKHKDMSGTMNSDIISTLNRATEDLIKKVYGREVVRTYMGVDTDFFRPLPVSSSIGNKRTVILHSTDYTMQKGTGYLIKALPLIKDKVRDVKLIITHTHCNPKEKTNLINRARMLGVDEYIEFAGTVPYSKLPEYYSLADVVVFTGHPECYGSTASLTVLEAMACETPAVRSIGCNEEVEDGVSGILVDPRNRVELADAIVKILLDKDLAKKMGKEGRNRVLTLYNWENVSKIFSDMISQLLERRV